jgi:hypothetical protein
MWWDVNATCPTELVYGELQAATHPSGGLPFAHQPVVNILLPCFMIPVSLLLLAWGRRVVRVSFGLLGFCAGAAVAVHVVHSGSGLALPCEGLVAISLAMGFICALVAACLLRLASFALGFACGGTIVFAVFMVFPPLATSVPLTSRVLLGYPLLLFWAALAVAGLFFGWIALHYRSITVIAITSILGGYGLAFGIRILARDKMSPTLHISLFALSAAAGAGLQVYLERRERAAIRKKLFPGVTSNLVLQRA